MRPELKFTIRLCREFTLIFIFVCAFYCDSAKVKAKDAKAEEKNDEANKEEFLLDILSEFDFDKIDDSLSLIFPEAKIQFGGVLESCISEDGLAGDRGVIGSLFKHISYELRSNRKSIIWILLIAVAAALFSNFANAFQNKQASEISFYVLYMLLLTVCLEAFHVTMTMTEEKIEILLDFMRLLCPSYFIAVAAATGSRTSLMFYNIVLFMIYVAEFVILKLILPIVNVYIIVSIMNFLTGEAHLSQLSDLLNKIVHWSLKTLITCVTGINLIQGMLAPAVDLVKRSSFTKTAEAVPVIGNALGGATDVILAAAVLIRNGIGVVGAVLILAICAAPVIHAAVLALLYKLVAAAVEPVCDKRITECISSMSAAYGLLVRIVFVTALLFLITVAVLTVSAGSHA